MKSYWRAAAMSAICALSVSVRAESTDGSTKGETKSRSERIEKVKERRENRFEQMKKERQERHAAFLAKLKEKLAERKNLTDAEKQDFVAIFENQFAENTEFWTTQHEENMAFLSELAAQPDLTKKTFMEKLKAHMDEQRAQNKDHRTDQRKERRSEIEKIKDNHKAGTTE